MSLQLTLSNGGYLCQGNCEDKPIQIGIILDESKLVNWHKSFFLLAEINFYGKYRSLRCNEQHGTWWIVSLKQILNRFFGWLCFISFNQSLLSLFGPEKSGTLHGINLCSKNPGSFSKTYTYSVHLLQLHKYLLGTFQRQSALWSFTSFLQEWTYLPSSRMAPEQLKI